MTVADLNFSLGVSGEREMERSLETIEDGLEDAQDAAERLDDEDPNVEVDADVADEQQKLQAALNTVRALNSKDANIDVDADGVQETIAEGVAAAQRLDDLEADIDLDVDRDGLRRAVSGLSPPDGGGGGGRGRVRLPGELDEFAEAGRAFSRLPAAAQGLVGAVAAATAALGAAGGLAGAATALATRLGDTELRQDLQKLKQRFRSLGATFVDSFEPVIRESIIPAGVALAEQLRSLIPDLKEFTQQNLPTLLSAVDGLVRAIAGTAKAFGLVARTLGILTSAVEGLINAFGAQQGFSGQAIQENVQAEFIDILQGFGFGGQEIGVSGASFQVPQTEVQTIVEQIRSGAASIGPPSTTPTDGASSRPFFARGSGGVPITEDLRKIERQIAVAREEAKRLDSVTQKDLLQSLKKLRRKGLKSLLMLEEKTGMSLDRTREYEVALEDLNDKLKRLKASNALEELAKETKQAADATKVPSAAEVAADNGTEGTSSIGSKLPGQVSGIPNAQKKINLLNQKINQTSAAGKRATSILQSGFLRVGDAIGSSLVNSIAQGKSAMQGLKSVFSSVIQSLISQLAGFAVKLGVIAPFLGAIGLGTGGAGAVVPAVSGAAGTGIFPFASGGIVTGPTLGLIGEAGENEAVMPLSRLGSMLDAAALSGATPAKTSVSVNVTGQTIRQGTSLKTVYDKTSRQQEQKHPTYRG